MIDLAERWAELQQRDPALAGDLGFMPYVLEDGWAIGGTPTVACSIGLGFRFGHRDLVLHCPTISSPDETNSLRAATDGLAHRIAGGDRLGPGDRATLKSKTIVFEASFRLVTAEDLLIFPCSELLLFHKLFLGKDDPPESPPVLWASVEKSYP